METSTAIKETKDEKQNADSILKPRLYRLGLICKALDKSTNKRTSHLIRLIELMPPRFFKLAAEHANANGLASALDMPSFLGKYQTSNEKYKALCDIVSAVASHVFWSPQDRAIGGGNNDIAALILNLIVGPRGGIRRISWVADLVLWDKRSTVYQMMDENPSRFKSFIHRVARYKLLRLFLSNLVAIPRNGNDFAICIQKFEKIDAGGVGTFEEKQSICTVFVKRNQLTKPSSVSTFSSETEDNEFIDKVKNLSRELNGKYALAPPMDLDTWLDEVILLVDQLEKLVVEPSFVKKGYLILLKPIAKIQIFHLFLDPQTFFPQLDPEELEEFKKRNIYDWPFWKVLKSNLEEWNQFSQKSIQDLLIQTTKRADFGESLLNLQIFSDVVFWVKIFFAFKEIKAAVFPKLIQSSPEKTNVNYFSVLLTPDDKDGVNDWAFVKKVYEIQTTTWSSLDKAVEIRQKDSVEKVIVENPFTYKEGKFKK